MPSPSTAAAITPVAASGSSRSGSGNPVTRCVWLEPGWRRLFTPPTQVGGATRLGVPAGMSPKTASTSRASACSSTGPDTATIRLLPVYWRAT